MKKVPHRIYLSEEQMPKQWYNLRADMKEQPDPMLNPATMKPIEEADLYPIFCRELAHQEMDAQTRYVDIPEEVQEFYKMTAKKALNHPVFRLEDQVFSSMEKHLFIDSSKPLYCKACLYYIAARLLEESGLSPRTAPSSDLLHQILITGAFTLLSIWIDRPEAGSRYTEESITIG